MKLDIKKIKIILAQKGLNQTEFARLLGARRQEVSRIFKQEGCCLKNVGRIAKALGVNVSEILAEE